jgi:hypothetical protein
MRDRSARSTARAAVARESGGANSEDEGVAVAAVAAAACRLSEVAAVAAATIVGGGDVSEVAAAVDVGGGDVVAWWVSEVAAAAVVGGGDVVAWWVSEVAAAAAVVGGGGGGPHRLLLAFAHAWRCLLAFVVAAMTRIDSLAALVAATWRIRSSVRSSRETGSGLSNT